mgnify:CR=1 FL=1
MVPDYKEMYLTLCRASEQAIDILIQAQKKCEELYLNEQEEQSKIISLRGDKKDRKD